MLARRAYSRKELFNKLLKKETDPGQAGKLIDELFSSGLINEEALTEDFIRQGRDYKLKGRFLLQLELKKKGIPEKTVYAVMDRDYPVTLEFDIAANYVEKQKNKLGNLALDKKIQRIGSALYRRGFPSNIISQLTNEIGKDKKEV